MNKAEWLQARRKGIGGSDAPSVAGVSKWKSPYELYLEKIGETNGQEQNEAMYWGSALEPVIRDRYAEETGAGLHALDPYQIFTHPDHPFMTSTPDGLTDNLVLEIKTARTAEGWGEAGTDEIPEPYLVQVTHNMAVCEREMADVAVLIGGQDFRIYHVPFDQQLWYMLFEMEQEFWQRVERREPPDPITFTDLTTRYGKKSEAREVTASLECLEAWADLKDLQELKKAEEDLKAIIMRHMKDADTLVEGDRVLCTWKLDRGGKRFSQQILKEKYPQIYAECMEEKQPTRRFLVKK